MSPRDDFFERMSAVDLRVRDAQSVQEYRARYLAPVPDFTVAQRMYLAVATRAADRYTRPYPRLHAIPWRVRRQSCRVEGGLPHTSATEPVTIMITSCQLASQPFRELIRTLVHEKIHCYQQLYPDETRMYIRDAMRLAPYRGDPAALVRMRNNPDTLSDAYTDGAQLYYSRYNSDEPACLTDVDYTRDHPYETMAYQLTARIVDQKPLPSATHEVFLASFA